MIDYIAIQEMNAYNAVQVKCLLFVLGDNKIISKNHANSGFENFADFQTSAQKLKSPLISLSCFERESII